MRVTKKGYENDHPISSLAFATATVNETISYERIGFEYLPRNYSVNPLFMYVIGSCFSAYLLIKFPNHQIASPL